jgi:hypothetical protein
VLWTALLAGQGPLITVFLVGSLFGARVN